MLAIGCHPELPRSQREIRDNWQFKATDSAAWLPARVPGTVHTDLLALGKIPDPLVGNNAEAGQWVEEQAWEYRTSFELTAAESNYPKIDLLFAGLDTYAEVLLNGRPVLAANNMFRQWRLAAKDLLVPGKNTLRVVFTPPAKASMEQAMALGYALPAGSETGKWHVSPFTRKAAYQFGWDFAPRLITMGVWQPVYLDFWQTARIESATFSLNQLSATEATYTVSLAVYGARDGATCTLQALDSEQELNLQAGYNNVAIDIRIPDPKLWWPNGWGEPYLYDIPIKLTAGGVVVDSIGKRLGIRTVELVQEFDSVGRSFFFKVNNQPLFVKGANWTPLSSFPTTVPDSVYRQRLAGVKEANMNMLRVWGGGIYERDLFYDLCDENGILVWQDLMFANSMYPGDDAFVRNVREEVQQQVKRLQSHPSLALWNGNNEIAVAWKNWGWQQQYGYSPADSAQIWHDYQRLFRQVIPQVIDLFDPDRDYTPTSPLSNWGKPENFKSGSMHYWGVWHGQDDFADYRHNVGRFMAEYGFQSYPGLATVNYYTAHAADVFAAPELSHQKSYVGNDMITRQITRYFGAPADARDFIAKSWQVQALALKTAIEAHRMHKPVCSGTLFWQLQDCWPGPGWSVIDYLGHKKPAYAVVSDRYKPVILIITDDRDDFTVAVANDRLQAVNGSLKLELFTAGNSRLWVFEKPVVAGANQTTTIYRSQVNKLLDGEPPDRVYLQATLTTETGEVDVENYYFVKPKDFPGEYDLIGR